MIWSAPLGPVTRLILDFCNIIIWSASLLAATNNSHWMDVALLKCGPRNMEHIEIWIEQGSWDWNWDTVCVDEGSTRPDSHRSGSNGHWNLLTIILGSGHMVIDASAQLYDHHHADNDAHHSLHFPPVQSNLVHQHADNVEVRRKRRRKTVNFALFIITNLFVKWIISTKGKFESNIQVYIQWVDELGE